MKIKLLIASSIAMALSNFTSSAWADCAQKLQSDEVVFYASANCKNARFNLKSSEKQSHLKKNNDMLSSVGVGENVKVELYMNSNYSGHKITLYPGGHPHLEQYGDKVSSVKVFPFDGGKLVSLFHLNGGMSVHPKQTVQYLAAGKYNYGSEKNQLLLDSDAASLYIPANLEVDLFTKWDGQGTKVSLKGGKNGKQVDLDQEGVKNRIKSIEVRKSGYRLVKSVVSNLSKDPFNPEKVVKTGTSAKCVASDTGGNLKCKSDLMYSTEQSVEVSTTNSRSATESIEIVESESVGVEGISSASLEVSVGLAVEEAHSGTDSSATTNSQQISFGYEVDPLPGSTLDIQLSAKMQPMTADITFYYENVLDKNDTFTTAGTLTYNNYSTARIVVTDESNNEISHNASKRAPVLDSGSGVPLSIDNPVETSYKGAMKMESDYDTEESSKTDGTHLLSAGHTLKKGLKHFSKSGQHYLIFEEKGDLLVYTKDDKFVWSMRDNISRKGHVDRVVYQHDGNLAAYNAKNGFMWSALHKAAPKGTELHLTDAGILKIVQPDGIVAWSSAP